MTRSLFIFFILLSPVLLFAKGVEDLSVEEKVGQMFMFGFSGTQFNKSLRAHLEKYKPGSVIVFGRNIKSLNQISKLNGSLQNNSVKILGVPLFIAIDQEGGAVSRIKTSPPLPSAYTIGHTNDPSLSFQAGKVTGEILKTVGFNMNLAPVLDITDAKLSSFISSRSFSDSAQKVSAMGIAFAQGLEEAHVLPIAKHFPGHGPISLDTHRTTPHRQVSFASLLANDLVPFSQFSSANLHSGVMVAHISYPIIDASGLPATFSQQLISKVLLNDLKYKGLIMTDDLEMAGAAALKTVEERVVAAVQAGNDILMLAWSQEQQANAFAALLDAVKSGKISEDRINKSVSKILKYKEYTQSLANRSLASVQDLKNELNKIQYASVYDDIISRFFKKLKTNSELLKSPPESYSVISRSEKFRSSFRRYIQSANVKEASSFKNLNKKSVSGLVVYHIASKKDLAALFKLSPEQKKNILVVSSLSRSSFEDKSAFIDVIEVYSSHPNLGGFVADAINSTLQESQTSSFLIPDASSWQKVSSKTQEVPRW